MTPGSPGAAMRGIPLSDFLAVLGVHFVAEQIGAWPSRKAVANVALFLAALLSSHVTAAVLGDRGTGRLVRLEGRSSVPGPQRPGRTHSRSCWCGTGHCRSRSACLR
jgi:hypothetical protein